MIAYHGGTLPWSRLHITCWSRNDILPVGEDLPAMVAHFAFDRHRRVQFEHEVAATAMRRDLHIEKAHAIIGMGNPDLILYTNECFERETPLGVRDVGGEGRLLTAPCPLDVLVSKDLGG